MRIASFIIGLISLLICWIPCVGGMAVVPAGIAFLFGFLGCLFAPKDCDTKGLGVAGLVLSLIALAVCSLQFGTAAKIYEQLKHGDDHAEAPAAEAPSMLKGRR